LALTVAPVVLAQDAAVEPAKEGRILRGAYCLALLPRSWFTDAGRWILLRSKRWHRPLKIGQGEFKALVAWGAVLTHCVELVKRTEILDLTDNTGVAGIKVRGRSPRFPLNVEARRVAAVELLLDARVRAPWVDTFHQPGDAGTRPDSEGRITLGQVIWQERSQFIELFACVSGHVVHHLKNNGIVDSHVINIHNDDAHSDSFRRPPLRSLYHRLESSKVRFLWAWLSQCCVDGENLEIIHRVATANGVHQVIVGPQGHPFWASQQLLRASDQQLTEGVASIITIDRCHYGASSRQRWIMWTTCSQLQSLQAKCRAIDGRCDATRRPHSSATADVNRQSIAGPGSFYPPEGFGRSAAAVIAQAMRA